MREYYKETLSLLRRQSYPAILSLLSPMLMTDVCMRMASWVVNSLEWLTFCEADFLRDLFRRMKTEAFAVKERIHAGRLNVLNLGVVARGGKFLVPGADRGPTWGDILLSAPALRNMAPARALTYVEVTTLTREDLEAVCSGYPESAKEVRRAAMTAALVKATELINDCLRRKREKQARRRASRDELARLDAQAQMRDAFGGGGESGGHSSPGGAEPDDPDDVLRMICGVASMPYRELKDGEVLEPEEAAAAPSKYGNDSIRGGGAFHTGHTGGGVASSAAVERLLGEMRAMREEQQSDAAYTASRLQKLEATMMRSAGMEQRDPSMLVRRPHVQRALRTCAAMNGAMQTWRRYAARMGLLAAAWGRLADKRLYVGWNTWLDYAVHRMYYTSCVRRAKSAPLARAFNTWDDAADAAAYAASTATATATAASAAGALLGPRAAAALMPPTDEADRV